MRKKIMTGIEIILLICVVFSFAYFEAKTFDDNLVSAVSTEEFLQSDSSKTSICLKTKVGSICQQVVRSACKDVCESEDLCVDNTRENVEQCLLGTCYDADEGTCEPRATKEKCEDDGGDFIDGDLMASDSRCERHCCLLNDVPKYMTARQCEKAADAIGKEEIFLTEIATEDACIYLGIQEQKGACMTGESEEVIDKNNCMLTTRNKCKEVRGNFTENLLCSNAELNTVCEKQNYTSCIEEFDEVYWFDSCGNKENIYDADEDKSWNDGIILARASNCAIGDVNNWLRNQGVCGNCNRLLGSSCGNKTSDEKLKDKNQDVVCRDLACEEEDGTRRENGETWCDYQSAIGTSAEIPFLGALGYFAKIPIPGHAMAAPGSRHFRRTCIDGEITIEQCDDFRNGICVEEQTKKGDSGDTISVASCRPNRWAECISYNSGGGDDGGLGKLTGIVSQIAQFVPKIGKVLQGPVEMQKAKIARMMIKCESDPDCFVKTVSVPNSEFNFPMCAPKYPPGFYEKESGGEDGNICKSATQTCASVWVKESTSFTFCATAKWVCKANCGCIDGSTPESAKPSQQFVNQMHELCVSLGDCGNKANYKGGQGNLAGYTVKKKVYEGLPKESNNQNKGNPVQVFSMPFDDSKPIPGKYIKAENDKVMESLGQSSNSGTGEGIETGGNPDFKPYDPTKMYLITGAAMGGSSLGLFVASQSGVWAASAGAGAAPLITTEVLTPVITQPGFVWSASGELVPSAGGEIATGLGGEPILTTTEMPASTVTGASPVMAGFATALTGAAIGMAVTSLLVGISGIGAGVGVGGSITYAATGAVGGAAVGLVVASSLNTAASAELAAFLGDLLGAPIFEALGPIGIAILIIVIADIITQWACGVGSMKTVEVTFECQEWQPPLGGANCEKCGEDDYTCTQYGCETLGATCEYVAEEPKSACYNENPNDVSSPEISFSGKVSEGYSGKQNGNQIKITKDDGECISQFDSVNTDITTNEDALCKFGKIGMKFEEMLDFDDGRYKKEHSHLFVYDDLSILGLELKNGERQEINFEVACQDRKGTITQGNARTVISLCIVPKDFTPPFANDVYTPNEWISYDSENAEIQRYNNEPAECRWSYEEEDFDDMENKMDCNNDEGNVELNGYKCTANVPIVNAEVKVCTKCKDKPELEGTDREDERQKNADCAWATIKKSQMQLEIISVKPDNETIITGSLQASVTVEAEVFGGVEETTRCYLGPNKLDELNNKGNNLFSKTYEKYTVGNYDLIIECEDAAGNKATKTGSFKIERDLTYPEITRIYEDSGSLVIVTSESGECAFVDEQKDTACNFDFDDGKPMNAAGNKRQEHRTGFDGLKTYYIKCRDDYGNMKGGCGAVVKRGFI